MRGRVLLDVGESRNAPDSSYLFVRTRKVTTKYSIYAYAFKSGLFGGRRTGVTPPASSIERNSFV